MSRPFLEVFPREIRDLIFTYILESPSGSVSLSPWSIDVARSLSILRVCKQIHRECKDIIWLHKGLVLRQPTEIYQKFSQISKTRRKRTRWVNFALEIMDRDEMEWIISGLKALQNWPGIEYITLRTVWENPRDVGEFKDMVRMRKCGLCIDGRLFKASGTPLRLNYDTGWPLFSPWGKQKWLKRMLLDSSGIEGLVNRIHNIFGGELYVDGVLCFKGRMQVAACILDPTNGEIRIVPESAIMKQDS